MEKGDAIVYNAGEFYNLSTYATGNQPFATYVDGDAYLLFRREDNADTGAEEINLYALHLAGGAEIKLIEGLGIFSYPQKVQMTSSGAQGIVIAGGGLPSTPPITFVSSYPNYIIDLVNIDDVSMSTIGARMSEAYMPSINLDGDIFCFLVPTSPAQIWIGQLRASAIYEEPSIANVSIEPTEVLLDGSSRTTVKAQVKTLSDSIHQVAVSAFKEGSYQFRAFTADWPGLILSNEGTLGDEDDSDHYFTNNTIRTDLITSPLGEYTIRIAAANSTLKEITAADYSPLSIVEELSNPSSINKNEGTGFPSLISPNPFTDEVTIHYTVRQPSPVTIEVFDLYGRRIQVLVDEQKAAGKHSICWTLGAGTNSKLTKGVFLCRIQMKDHLEISKMTYLK